MKIWKLKTKEYKTEDRQIVILVIDFKNINDWKAKAYYSG